MKILACADLHGRRERADKVRELVAHHRPDAVVLPGDITHTGRGTEALALLDELAGPVLAITGNMDPPAVARAIRDSRAKDPSDAPVEIKGVTFGGLGVPRCDVLVVHEPPRGTLDRVPSGAHIGSPAVRDYIEKRRPRVVLCGHVHECPGVVELGATTVVNCTMGDGRHAGAIVRLEGEKVQVELLAL
ncbi:MAG: metallophosphoesterase family protein [Armatimonadetes bacterium]|nr:metallophosphoesterase family protein [Armatimonadota bacterium]